MARVQARVEGFQRGQQHQRVAVAVEQRGELCLLPQPHLAHARLKDGALVDGAGMGIEHGHGQGAHIFQRVLETGLGGADAGQGQFKERHRDGRGGKTCIVDDSRATP